MQNSSVLMQNSSFLNEEFISFNAEFISFNTKFTASSALSVFYYKNQDSSLEIQIHEWENPDSSK